MYRGFTYRLHPTAEQADTFIRFSGVCRLVWNLALEQRRDHWRRYQARTGNNLNYVTQARELTALRAEVDFVRAVHVTPLQRTLKALDEAYRRAWEAKGGYPQPKKKGVHDAFSYAGREIAFETINRRWGRVRLPKIGWVKLRLTRPLEAGMVVTIEPGLYFIPLLLRERKASPLAAHVDWAGVEALLPFGGIRIEDDVACRADGAAENLTRDAFALLEA